MIAIGLLHSTFKTVIGSILTARAAGAIAAKAVMHNMVNSTPMKTSVSVAFMQL